LKERTSYARHTSDSQNLYIWLSNESILIHNHGSQQKTKELITISNSTSQTNQWMDQRTLDRMIGPFAGSFMRIVGSLMGLKNQNNQQLLTKSNDHPTLNI